ncbi:MAG: tetratricopeptide repeat protein [Peptostreptococcaceae bacterium]|nr:tetratricopeptide repeat protein [Peptostreptococcaceae bacterium]
MNKKILDINLISDNENEFTFFNIDDEEANETLKALKKTYVTANSKEETILKLKQNSNNINKDLKQLKLESYKKYNEALNMLEKDFINSASDMIDEALELNPKDVDILNLKGLVKVLKCDFDQAFESFYKSLCYGNNELSKKYVSILASDNFGIFLSRYNHAIRFINKGLNEESIQIFENITTEQPDLIEPYLLLHLIYNKLGNENKSNEYLNILKYIDKDNPMFEIKENIQDVQEEKVDNKKGTNKGKYIYISIILGLVIGIGVLYSNSKNKLEQLSSKINEKEEKINQTNDKLNKINSELEEMKNKEESIVETQTEIIVADEEELSEKAQKLKSQGDTSEAIKYYKLVVENGKTKKYISEAIYQVAYLNEKLKNYDEAIKYYKKYVYTYNSSENYFDDCYYNMGMIYYNNGDLENAKKMFYSLRAEDPDSIYNNSKVKEILKEK